MSGEKREEVKDESQQQKAWGGEKRETKGEGGGGKEGLDVTFFSSFTIQFLNYILHIDCSFGIHDLWLTFTNNSSCLGFRWMKM